MAQWVSVNGYGNENMEPDVLNRPVRQLTERTQYLYDRVSSMIGADTFESVRTLNAVLETTGAYAPTVGDFVYFDRSTNTYKKAMVGSSAEDAAIASDQSYPLGLLSAVNADGTGTIVLYGKLDLATSGSGWDLNSMIEDGDETYSDGRYYLSATEAGKMTASPTGLAVYLGQFVEDEDNPGYGGYAILNPQYKDMSEAHFHRAYPLYDQPAGRHVVSGYTPADTHSITGFAPETAASGSDIIPRLVIRGAWLGNTATQYTIWLSSSSDDDETLVASSDPSSDWSTVYLHWSSSDTDEGSGAEQLRSFQSLVSIGTKGVQGYLEAMAGQDPDVAFNPDGSDADKRTWVLNAPNDIVGWRTKNIQQYFSDYPATDNGFSFIIYGEPTERSDSRLYDTITMKSGDIYAIAYTGQPSASDTLTIETTTFEFYSGTYAGSDTGVLIGSDADTSYTNLLTAILAADTSYADAALTTDNGILVVLVNTGDTVSGSLTNATIPVSPFDGTGDLVTGDAGLLIYDQNHEALVDHATIPYWKNIAYWDEIELLNGLTVVAIPYDTDASAATADTVAALDYWDVDIADEAPGCLFAYAMGMHQSLAQQYPPVPRAAATLVMNGVELASYTHFPSNYNFRIGTSTIYWRSNEYGTVPWALDWTSYESPGSDVYQKYILFHLVKIAAAATGVVTSLQPAAGSPISVRQCGTSEAANVGDLELDLDLNLATDDNELAGYQVVKSVSGQKLLRGPVVERIKTDGTITIIQSEGAPDGQGVVTLSTGSAGYTGEFETVALENAKQEVLGMFPYVKLLGWSTGGSNINTAFIMKFAVPHTISYSEAFKVRVYATVFGETDIPFTVGGSPLYAGLAFSYSILPDYNAILSPTGSDDVTSVLDETLPDGMLTLTSPITVDVPLGKYDASAPGENIYNAYDPMLIHNDSTLPYQERRQVQVLGNDLPEKDLLYNWTDTEDPVVRAGSLVAIRIARADTSQPTAEYTGPLGFINLRWRLVSV